MVPWLSCERASESRSMSVCMSVCGRMASISCEKTLEGNKLRHTKPQRQRAQKQFNLAEKLNVSAVLPSTVVKKMSVLPRALLD